MQRKFAPGRGHTISGSSGPGPSARDIALVDAEAGRLERSGPYFRSSIVVRF